MTSIALDKDDESEYSIFYNIYKNDGNFSENNSSFFGLSKNGEILFRFLVQGVGITLLSFFGIIGNTLTIIVLSKKKMRSPIGCFLRGLACADAVFTAIATLVVGVPCFVSYVADLGDIGIGVVTKSNLAFLTPIFFGLGVTTLSASIYFTVAVTIERYIAVCHPFKARSLLTYKRAVNVSFGIVIFAILYNAPRWWEYEILEIYDPVTKELTGYRPVPSKLRMHPLYDTYYCYTAYPIFMVSLPLLALIILNILIYRAVRRANNQRRRLSSSERHENGLAKMLLVVVSISIFCNSFQLFEVMHRKVYSRKNESLTEIEAIRNLIVVFNCSVNFVIYCFMAGKFQQVFLDLWPQWIRERLCCCCPESEKRRSWNRTDFSGTKVDVCKFPSFISLSTASTKTLQDVSLSGVFVSHI